MADRSKWFEVEEDCLDPFLPPRGVYLCIYLFTFEADGIETFFLAQW